MVTKSRGRSASVERAINRKVVVARRKFRGLQGLTADAAATMFWGLFLERTRR